MQPTRIEPGPGQESVWDYPRPPKLETSQDLIRVFFNNIIIAETTRAIRVLETSYPPVYYIPPDDIRMEFLKPVPQQNYLCEWKGEARYYTVQVCNRVAPSAAQYYPEPTKRFLSIRNYVAFYPHSMDSCYVNEELVKPQPGNFYGGWITSNIVGPFVSGPGLGDW